MTRHWGQWAPLVWLPLRNLTMHLSIRRKSNRSKPGGTVYFNRKKKMPWYLLSCLTHSLCVGGKGPRNSYSPRVEAIDHGVESYKLVTDTTIVKILRNEGKPVTPGRAEVRLCWQGMPSREIRYWVMKPQTSAANVSRAGSCPGGQRTLYKGCTMKGYHLQGPKLFIPTNSYITPLTHISLNITWKEAPPFLCSLCVLHVSQEIWLTGQFSQVSCYFMEVCLHPKKLMTQAPSKSKGKEKKTP